MTQLQVVGVSPLFLAVQHTDGVRRSYAAPADRRFTAARTIKLIEPTPFTLDRCVSLLSYASPSWALIDNVVVYVRPARRVLELRPTTNDASKHDYEAPKGYRWSLTPGTRDGCRAWTFSNMTPYTVHCFATSLQPLRGPPLHNYDLMIPWTSPSLTEMLTVFLIPDVQAKV